MRAIRATPGGLLQVFLVMTALLVAGCGSQGGVRDPTAAPSPLSPTQPGSPTASPLPLRPVDQPTLWLCRPGMADNPCEGGLDSTVINADGIPNGRAVRTR